MTIYDILILCDQSQEIEIWLKSILSDRYRRYTTDTVESIISNEVSIHTATVTLISTASTDDDLLTIHAVEV